VLRDIAGETSLRIDFGGGIRSADDVERALDAGAAMVNVGSAAVNQRDAFKEWIDAYGAERFVVAADARHGKVATHGWQASSTEDVDTFIAGHADKGIKEFICTDISRDGRLEGPSVALYRRLIASIDAVCIIASGGIRNVEDMRRLEETGACAAIVGKALFEGLLTLAELSDWT
jgi:phosphoribosylformimino-5-aminoimidazole carboxamide ribotide isomerase